MGSGLGVDVHPYYQRGARFDGVEYAWVKMTDGTSAYAVKRDGVWWAADEHARRLRAAGKPFGGYCYAQPGSGAAAAQALWAECQRLGGTGIAPADDIESNKDIHIWTKAEATDHGRSFCSWFCARGVRPAIYMSASFAQTCRPDLWPENPVIWVARYGRKPESGGMYTGRYDVHQYDDLGSLPGSAGAVDWNQAYTSAHLLGSQPAPVTRPARKDDPVKLRAKFDDAGKPVKTHDEVPVMGGKALRLATSYGQVVQVHGVTGVYDTNHTPQTVSIKGEFQLDPDRPGPIGTLPDGLSHCVVEYTAAADFTGWCF